MALFTKKKKEYTESDSIYAPVDGFLMDITQVNDSVFNTKMMGDGMAIVPSSQQLFSPVDGEVILVSKTKHAIGFRTVDGKEILLHIGLDTVQLQGKYFSIKVKAGQKIRKGEIVGSVDFAALRDQGYDTSTIIVITNNAQVQKIATDKNIMHNERIME